MTTPAILTFMAALLTVAFFVANVIQAVKRGFATNESHLSFFTDPISAGLRGPGGKMLRGAFYGFAVALVLLAYGIPGHLDWMISLWVAAVSVVGVAYTKKMQDDHPNDTAANAKLEHVHLLCAALAFGGATVAEILHFFGTPLMPWSFAPVVVALVFLVFAKDLTAVCEKLYTLTLLSLIVLITVPVV